MLYDKNIKLNKNSYITYNDFFEDNYYEDYKIYSNESYEDYKIKRNIYTSAIKLNNSSSIEDFNIYRYDDYLESVKLKHYKQQLKDKLDERNCWTYIYNLIC